MLRAHLNVFANLQDSLVTLKYPLLILNDYTNVFNHVLGAFIDLVLLNGVLLIPIRL